MYKNERGSHHNLSFDFTYNDMVSSGRSSCSIDFIFSPLHFTAEYISSGLQEHSSGHLLLNIPTITSVVENIVVLGPLNSVELMVSLANEDALEQRMLSLRTNENSSKYTFLHILADVMICQYRIKNTVRGKNCEEQKVFKLYS